MRDFLNACDPMPMALGAKVLPAAEVPVCQMVEFEKGDHEVVPAAEAWASLLADIATITTAFQALATQTIVAREFRDGQLAGVSYAIGGSTVPMPSGVVESPAFVLSRAELSALAESQAYWQAFDRGEPSCTASFAEPMNFGGAPEMDRRPPSLSDWWLTNCDGSGFTD